jgi:hypothetical protein
MNLDDFFRLGDYATDRAFGDGLIRAGMQLMAPSLQRVLGTGKIRVANNSEDMYQATDVVAIGERGKLNIALRRRKESYPWNDFTIRLHRDNGAATEFDKIIAGETDWMFYAHCDRAATSISNWMLLSMTIWRRGMKRWGVTDWMSLRAKYECGQLDGCVSTIQQNNDAFGDEDLPQARRKGTWFAAFDVRAWEAAGLGIVIDGTVLDKIRGT